MIVTIKEQKFEVIKNEKEGFDASAVEERLTDYFDGYDYIVGDWAYDKLRLKGFNNKGNKLYNKFNDYNNVDKYIKENCAYGCKHFILKRNKVE